ncbi:GGDEF domain-containing protein [Roseivivax sp. CAU 1753]
MTCAAPHLVDRLCPMHLTVDRTGTVQRVGPTLSKVIGPVSGQKLFDILQIERPRGIAAMQALLARTGRKLHIRTKGAPDTPMVGHAIDTPDGGAVLNLGFGIGVAEAVRRHGLTGSEFAPTDLTMEMLFLIEAQSAAMNASRMLNLRLHSARIVAEAEAATDTLTGLGNRRAVELTLDALAADEVPFGIVHLDLDFFKQVNDRWGHAAGDAVLCDVAEALTGTVRPHDIAARIGGDEFLLIFPSLSDAGQIAALCERLIARIEQPGRGKPEGAHVSASAGIAIWPGGPGADPAQMVDLADQALYASKRAGRGCVSVSDAATTVAQTDAVTGAGILASGS